jgi:DNA-binding MarR family transcriptional regulator
VNRLVRLKYVRRVTDPKNRKLVRLKITDAGAQAVSQMMRRKGDEARKMFELISEKDQKELLRILQSLHDSFLSRQL